MSSIIALALSLLGVLGAPSSTPAATSSITQPTYYAVSYGAKCDDATDDSAAFAALFQAARANCTITNNIPISQATVDFPPGETCKVNSGLTIDTSCIAVRTNGATLDCSGIAAGGACVTTTTYDLVSPYNGNVSIADLKMVGLGKSTSSGTVGLLSGSASVTYTGLSAAGFNYGVKISNYSWLNTWINPQLFYDGTGWYCLNGLTDAGEDQSIVGGAIYNNTTGLDTEGCEVNSVNTAFDYETASVANVGAQLTLEDSHIEFNSLSGAMFNLSGSNSFEYFVANGGRWVSNNSSNSESATVNNSGYGADGGWGPWAQINNIFTANLWPFSSCVSASQATCAIGNNASQVKFFDVRDSQGNIKSTAQTN